jgi:DNA modification methylase
MASRKMGQSPWIKKAGRGLKIAIVYRRLGEVKPNPRNSHRHSQEQIEKLARNISIFGFLIPIVTNSRGEIICGHARYAAAELAGIREVPTILVEHLSPEQLQAFGIAENRLVSMDWDDPQLAVQLKEISGLDLGLTLEDLGFETPQLDALMVDVNGPRSQTPDPADALPPITEETVTKLGDLWELGPHRLYCGDAKEEESYSVLMGRKRAAMVFSDPPWNIAVEGNISGLGRVKHKNFIQGSGELSPLEYLEFLTKSFTLLAKHSTDGSLHYLCSGAKQIGAFLAAGAKTYSQFLNLIVWDKGVGAMGGLYRHACEFILLFKNGIGRSRNNVVLGRYGRNRTTVWRYPGMASFARAKDEGNLLAEHPTSKPRRLVSDAILDCTARGDVVLDAFAGSGTLLVAAESVGRVGFAIELDPRFVDVSVRRWQRFTGQQATHAASGRSFDELQEKGRANGEKKGS